MTPIADASTAPLVLTATQHLGACYSLAPPITCRAELSGQAMLSAARAPATGSSSAAALTVATSSSVTDSPREHQLSAWEALVAAKRDDAAQPPPTARSATSDCDVLPSARTAVATTIPRRTPTASSSSSLSHSAAPFRPPPVTAADEPTACRLSGLRIRDRRQQASEVERQLSRCKVVKLAALSKWQQDMQTVGAGAASELEWVAFGVVAMKSDIRSSSRGEKFVILTLCDLSGHLLSCFLFGRAFQQHHSTDVGSVVAVANAKVLHSDAHSSPSQAASSSPAFLSLSLSVSQPSQLLVLGTSFDFALCASYKREQLVAGGPSSSSLLRCRNIVDLRHGKYCDFHVREEYKRIAGSRPGVNRQVAGELSGLVRFGDKRMAASRASATSANSKMQFPAAARAGLGGEGWVAASVSSGTVFMMPPLRHAGKTAGSSVTSAKPLAALKPSTDSARMLAMIQAERGKAVAVGKDITSSPALPVLPIPSPPTKAPTQPAPTARLAQRSPSTPASVAQLRSNRALAAASASALNSKPTPSRDPSLTTTITSSLLSSDSPFAAVQKPKPMSREEATRELRRLHALKALAKHGPVAAPDPNSSHVDETHASRTAATRKRKPESNFIQVCLTSSGEMSVRHQPSSAAAEAPPSLGPLSPGRDAKRARLEALFGEMSSARFQQLLSASSAHVELLADMKQDEREQYWQWLEEKETMQQQMQAIREQQVEVWLCADCNGRRTVHFPALCHASGHRLDKRAATKRFFECGQCRSRVTTMDSALPLHCCHKCGAAQWKASGLISERAGMAASVRSELQHKSEETWLRSCSGADGSMRNDDPNNTQGVVHEDDR